MGIRQAGLAGVKYSSCMYKMHLYVLSCCLSLTHDIQRLDISRHGRDSRRFALKGKGEESPIATSCLGLVYRHMYDGGKLSQWQHSIANFLAGCK